MFDISSRPQGTGRVTAGWPMPACSRSHLHPVRSVRPLPQEDKKDTQTSCLRDSFTCRTKSHDPEWVQCVQLYESVHIHTQNCNCEQSLQFASAAMVLGACVSCCVRWLLVSVLREKDGRPHTGRPCEKHRLTRFSCSLQQPPAKNMSRPNLQRAPSGLQLLCIALRL